MNPNHLPSPPPTPFTPSTTSTFALPSSPSSSPPPSLFPSLPPPPQTNLSPNTIPLLHRRLHNRPFTHLLRSLSPLLSIETGLPHPAFPQTILHYHLLTPRTLDSLAHFYHQRTPSVFSLGYPMPIVGRWFAPPNPIPTEEDLEEGEIDEMGEIRKILADAFAGGRGGDVVFEEVGEKRRRFGRFCGLAGMESAACDGEGEMRREMEAWVAGEVERREGRRREREVERLKGFW